VILIAGPNFGTGSSREHAVWALTDFGFRAVISPRFGDIFRNNATKAGLVPVQVDAELGETLMAAVEADPTLEITVDVVDRMVRAPSLGIEAPFPLDDFTRHRLVEGLDDIGITLHHADDISAYEARRPDYLPITSAT
jgi:3-isopropylmalate/(R)-2-methylmalate dehydratase small subunit